MIEHVAGGGPEPFEAAFVAVAIGFGIACFSLLWLGRVVRLRRGQKLAEWAVRERLARWRLAAESNGAGRVAAAADRAGGDPPG